jgi:hypothetical protein
MNRNGIPKLYQGGYERALSGRASPRQAIKAFCQSCVGYENVAEEIRQCTGAECPLYAYRPYRGRVRRAPQSCQTPDLRGFGAVESKNSGQ